MSLYETCGKCEGCGTTDRRRTNPDRCPACRGEGKVKVRPNSERLQLVAALDHAPNRVLVCDATFDADGTRKPGTWHWPPREL